MSTDLSKAAWSGETAAIDWGAPTQEVEAPSPAASASVPTLAADGAVTPCTIFQGLLDAPPTIIAATGIPELDRLCGGGFPVPWRVLLVGMPSAWKTGLAIYLADQFEHDGFYVGVLAIDEEAEDVTIRFAQMGGFDRAKLQKQDREEIAEAREAFASARIVFYDFMWTIEKAGADLAKRAAAVGARAALVIDSIQTARSDALAAKTAPSPRDTVEANVAAFREVTTAHKMLGIATSEANRAAYRGGGQMQASMAAGAESRSIEYAAQTMIVLRADDDEPDTLFHADVAKNRARLKGEFSFRLNRHAHRIEPVREGELKAERKEAQKAEKRSAVEADAVAIARELHVAPGLTTNRLHDALRARHGTFSEGRAEAGLNALGAGVERRDGANRSKEHYLRPGGLPSHVLTAMPELQAAAA